MRLHRDHVAGGFFVVAGALALAVSGDLPFGTLASPGAGMMPTLAVGLMMTLGATILARARESPPLAAISWSDLGHAAWLVVVAAAAVALYDRLGFLVVVPALLFTLIFVVERRRILSALAVGIGVTALTYLLFTRVLRTPLPPVPRDLIGL